MLSEDQALTVLSKLVTWLVHSVQRDESSLVVRKLCSALTTYCIRSSIPWDRPLLDLVSSFRDGQFTNGVIETSLLDLVPSLSPAETTASLWFSAALAEEVGKVDGATSGHARLHEQMESIVSDASIIMARAFNDTRLQIEALKTLSSWVDYAQPMWPTKPEVLQ